MKPSKKKQDIQRKVVQEKIHRFLRNDEPAPPSGWIKAIRGSLGLSIRQLASRVGVGHGSIDQLEKREPQKRVTLESLEKAAHAMDCKLVYAIVPMNEGATLDTILQVRAHVVAFKILASVNQTMKLEAQSITKKQAKGEINRIVEEVLSINDPRLWDPSIPFIPRRSKKK